jgi:hypothetical protein
MIPAKAGYITKKGDYLRRISASIPMTATAPTTSATGSGEVWVGVGVPAKTSGTDDVASIDEAPSAERVTSPLSGRGIP